MGMILPDCALHSYSGMQAFLHGLDLKEVILNGPFDPLNSADKKQQETLPWPS